MPTLKSLVENLKSEGWLKTPKIIEAFENIKREDFVLDKEWAYVDTALPVGYNQTISQPLVVAFMLELLQPKEEEKILDIGSGSGWTTALLAHIVSQKGNPKPEIRNPKQTLNSKIPISKGRIIAVEIIPELKNLGEENVKKYNFIEKGIVKFVLGDGKFGYKNEAPYDKILVSASATEIPQELKNQLKIGGKIVIPIYDSIVEATKINQDRFEEREYPGFVFVPLI